MPGDPSSFRLRYPALASATDETIVYWITDADRYVTDAWGLDADSGRLSYAAHHIALTPGATTGEAAQIGQLASSGVTSFNSGTFSATISDGAVAARVKGGFAATPYGAEFAMLLRRYAGGPFLAGYADPSHMVR